MKVLVTGGLGYIGSHTVVDLQNHGYEVIIIDNLSNSHLSVLDSITAITGKQPEFHNFDLCNFELCQKFFSDNINLDSIIHFAAAKIVNESVAEPLHYYENNLTALTNITKCLGEITKASSKKINFIQSSSCSVYGDAKTIPVSETTPFGQAKSPYANTKQISEEILQDLIVAGADLQVVALRYFNPIGAHDSGLIGELPLKVPQNIVPVITRTAVGLQKELNIFGNDYPTPDGTCIRDYINVLDLAKAHRLTLDKLLSNNKNNFSSYEAINLGTGKGVSVLELIHSFEKISGVKVNYCIGKKRAGDIVEIYTDNHKLKNLLDWVPEHTHEDALKNAWQWQLNLKKQT